MAKHAYVVYLGVEDYDVTVQWQYMLTESRKQNLIPDIFLFLQHNPVITLGRGGGKENLLVSPGYLDSTGIVLRQTNRGGNITYHGPGQVVAYPIIDLTQHRADVHWYVRQLEEVVILLLRRYGMKGERINGKTGVWLGQRKIAAIGVAIRRWITSHGLALNVNNDLTPFTYMVPCGLHGHAVTSMAQETGGQNFDERLIQQELASLFAETFSLELEEISRDDFLAMMVTLGKQTEFGKTAC